MCASYIILIHAQVCLVEANIRFIYYIIMIVVNKTLITIDMRIAPIWRKSYHKLLQNVFLRSTPQISQTTRVQIINVVTMYSIKTALHIDQLATYIQDRPMFNMSDYHMDISRY